MISLARKPVEANLAEHDGERMRWCFTPLPTEVRKVSDFPINGGDFGLRARVQSRWSNLTSVKQAIPERSPRRAGRSQIFRSSGRIRKRATKHEALDVFPQFLPTSRGSQLSSGQVRDQVQPGWMIATIGVAMTWCCEELSADY